MDATTDRALINNSFYDSLADRWYEADDDPVALLRIETREKLRWARPHLADARTVLDIGCGGGFASNALARDGFKVTGLDFSAPSLAVAESRDETAAVSYVQGDAYALPFADAAFDAVIAFDFLEHVSDPARIIREAARVVKPGGVFLFHTFNRNPLSWLVVLKGVEWFVRNTPEHMHVYRMFLKPTEVGRACHDAGLNVESWQGLRPRIDGAFFRLLRTRRVPADFQFTATPSLMMSYCGVARRTSVPD